MTAFCAYRRACLSRGANSHEELLPLPFPTNPQSAHERPVCRAATTKRVRFGRRVDSTYLLIRLRQTWADAER